jgi:hypothetical protein
MEFQQIGWFSCNLWRGICKIFYNLLHKICMSYNLGQQGIWSRI